jgi:hypothetical protein
VVVCLCGGVVVEKDVTEFDELASKGRLFSHVDGFAAPGVGIERLRDVARDAGVQRGQLGAVSAGRPDMVAIDRLVRATTSKEEFMTRSRIRPTGISRGCCHWCGC